MKKCSSPVSCIIAIVWVILYGAEQGNWGMDPSAPDGLKNFLPEWMEAVERDFNHPAIIGWCPFNETWDYEGASRMTTFWQLSIG